MGSPPYPNVESFGKAWDQVKIDHPGKALRANRNTACYAFLINVARFLIDLQNTRVLNEARRKKQEKEIERQLKEKTSKAKASSAAADKKDSHNSGKDNNGSNSPAIAGGGSSGGIGGGVAGLKKRPGTKVDLVAGIASRQSQPTTLRDVRRQRDRALAVSVFPEEEKKGNRRSGDRDKGDDSSSSGGSFGEMTTEYRRNHANTDSDKPAFMDRSRLKKNSSK